MTYSLITSLLWLAIFPFRADMTSVDCTDVGDGSHHDDVIKWKIFRVTGHLCGEFTGHRWMPCTKASDAELWCFFYLRLNKRLSKQSWGWWFKTPSSSLWRHCNAEMTGKLFLMEGYLTGGANETVDPPYVSLKLLNGNNTRLLWICLINTFVLRNVYLCNSVMSCAISCFDWYMHIQRISLSNHNILTSGRIWHTSDTNQTFMCIIMPICDLT